MDNLEQLQHTRSQFREFMKSVYHVTGLTENDMHNLGYVDIAKRIPNSAIKQEYCLLARKLLEENIRALQTSDEEEFTSEWAETLLLWCKVREELQLV